VAAHSTCVDGHNCWAVFSTPTHSVRSIACTIPHLDKECVCGRGDLRTAVFGITGNLEKSLRRRSISRSMSGADACAFRVDRPGIVPQPYQFAAVPPGRLCHAPQNTVPDSPSLRVIRQCEPLSEFVRRGGGVTQPPDVLIPPKWGFVCHAK
jgi:hypothetical protein